MAEREGFEPSEQVTPLSGLANRRTRPLCDLSPEGPEDSTGLPFRPSYDPVYQGAKPVPASATLKSSPSLWLFVSLIVKPEKSTNEPADPGENS